MYLKETGYEDMD